MRIRNTLDTPANRAGMPNADFTSWTPLNAVARCVITAVDLN